MKKCLFYSTVVVFIVFTSFTNKHTDKIVNYYNIPESLNFDGLTYSLSWSSHPNDIYFKQEYIPVDNSADHFKDMLLIDFIITDMSVATVADAQVSKLKERKKADMVCNYQLLNNSKTGDYMLDFIMSESKDNAVNLIEWNAYHYKSYTDKQGHKGVLLFGVSHRAYDNDVNAFLKSLGKYRNQKLMVLNGYNVPEIQIK
jgi:hypothetical protein